MIDLPYAFLLELQKQLPGLFSARSSKSCANKLAKPIPAAIDGHQRFSVTCNEPGPRIRQYAAIHLRLKALPGLAPRMRKIPLGVTGGQLESDENNRPRDVT
jgi:hypothetical protein